MTSREQEQYEYTRITVYNRAVGRCEVCGKPIGYLEYQMAHRIPQRKHFLKRFGKEVIHHYMNFAATCSLRCNNKVSIGNHPIEIENLAKTIREIINNG